MSECLRYIDDFPGARAECERNIAAGHYCRDCPHNLNSDRQMNEWWAYEDGDGIQFLPNEAEAREFADGATITHYIPASRIASLEAANERLTQERDEWKERAEFREVEMSRRVKECLKANAEVIADWEKAKSALAAAQVEISKWKEIAEEWQDEALVRSNNNP